MTRRYRHPSGADKGITQFLFTAWKLAGIEFPGASGGPSTPQQRKDFIQWLWGTGTRYRPFAVHQLRRPHNGVTSFPTTDRLLLTFIWVYGFSLIGGRYLSFRPTNYISIKRMAGYSFMEIVLTNTLLAIQSFSWDVNALFAISWLHQNPISVICSLLWGPHQPFHRYNRLTT